MTDSIVNAPQQPGSGKGPAYLIGAIGGLAVGVLVTYFAAGTGGAGRGGDPVVAKYNGTPVKASEAFAPIKTRLFDLEEELYRTKEQAINDFIEQRLLDAEAKKQGLPIEQLVEKSLGAESGEVTDKDIESFLTSKGLSLNDPRIKKEDVRDYLRYRRRFDKRQAFVAKLRESANVKLLLQEPESPKLKVTADGYPAWGNPKAPVTIVEFSDFQCPFCSRAVPTLNQIKQTYGPDKVRIVFRDMPLPSHNRAEPAALASHCANEQGKFWEMHDKLFENQTKLEDADLKGYAKALGLDSAKFSECFDSKRYAGIIEKSKREAESLGIQATPSFVINGVLLQGAQPFERFKEKIDRAMSKG
jgi:protein-disulfide isomerase